MVNRNNAPNKTPCGSDHRLFSKMRQEVKSPETGLAVFVSRLSGRGSASVVEQLPGVEDPSVSKEHEYKQYKEYNNEDEATGR